MLSQQDLVQLSQKDIAEEQINTQLGQFTTGFPFLKLKAAASIEDGIVATNTTRSRDNLKTPEKAVEAIGEGGLSGAPLYVKALATVKYVHEKSNGLLPIIACGGIMTPQQAAEMLDAGASLVEVYSGFIYNGPAFAKRIVRYLKRKKRQ